jgi:catechol 2,3-dioxygenase-like lactoylglutathione lyase family enzyme
MLSAHEATATVAVKEMDRATQFYEGVLGLERVHNEGGQAISYRTGKTTLLVYKSEFAGTNKATTVTWSLGGDLDACVNDLAGKGVQFERYDMPNTRHEGNIHVAGELRVAWFKDPDGNIHALVQS